MSREGANSPEGGLHFGDGDLDSPKLREHAFGFVDSLAEGVGIRHPAASDLPRQIASGLRAGSADSQRTLMGLDQLKDFEFFFVFHACG